MKVFIWVSDSPFPYVSEVEMVFKQGHLKERNQILVRSS